MITRSTPLFRRWPLAPDGRTLALTFADHIALLDADTGAELAMFDTGGSQAAYLPDGTQLLVLTEGGSENTHAGDRRMGAAAGCAGGRGFFA